MFEQKAKKISQRQGCKYFGFRTHPKYYSTLYTTLDDYLRQMTKLSQSYNSFLKMAH